MSILSESKRCRSNRTMPPAFAFRTRKNSRSFGTFWPMGNMRWLKNRCSHRRPKFASCSNSPEAQQAACYTAYNHRFEPHIARLKKILDSGNLGRIYLAKFFYGNGTARDVRNSAWRDNGLGVFSDLGSHMLDMAHFLFGPNGEAGELWCADRFENKAPDHVLFGYRGKPVLEMEATLLSWRNTFRLDLFGELGSAHIDCLCKWGPSTLTIRKRVLPSGRPEESVEVIEQPDPTWQLEYDHFLALCGTAGTNLENDIWIHEKIRKLGGLIEQVHP